MDEKEKLKALAVLLESDGWRVLNEWMGHVLTSHENDVFSTRDPDMRAVSVGFCKAIKQVREWPHNTFVFTKANLDNKSKESLQPT